MDGSATRTNTSQSCTVDEDPLETREWLESLSSVIQQCGAERGQFLVHQLADALRQIGAADTTQKFSAYRNTIPLERQGAYPGLALEERITSILRWNALAMVMRANHAYGDLGGHIASYTSAAEIFEVGFNHFFAPTQMVPLVIWCSINPIRHPVSMREHSSKAG